MIRPIMMQLMTHYRIPEMTESLMGKASFTHGQSIIFENFTPGLGARFSSGTSLYVLGPSTFLGSRALSNRDYFFLESRGRRQHY